MANRRKDIRKAVVAKLINATTAAERVFNSKVDPLWDETYPTLIVYGRDEDSERSYVGQPELTRSLKIMIEASVEGTGDPAEIIDDTIDDLCSEIEIALGDDVSDLITECVLINFVSDVTNEGEKPFGVAVMTFQVSYIA